MRRLVILLAASLSLGSVTAATEPSAVVDHYADIAQAKYADALAGARQLQQAVDSLINAPSDETLSAAREAWKLARVPYQQSEVYRFGNAIVDDWEGKVNAWPLDEGLIDYVAADLYGEGSGENPLYSANVIANPSLIIGGKEIDASLIDKRLLAERLQEADGVETNVATGYHAIEFLLWGQDLNGTGPGAGARPATDFSASDCTGGNCERRAAFLAAATELLVDDLTWITEQWAADGAARMALHESGPKGALAAILTGMGSLSYGELAGERMRLGLMLHDPEEEHDCFSDNTHRSHFYDALGIRNVYLGRYQRPDGTVLTGPSLSDLVSAADPALDARMRESLDASLARMQAIVDSAERNGVAYDQLIGAGNDAGNALVQAAIDALVAQTRVIESVIAILKLDGTSIEGSDSLDAPEKVGS